MDVRPYQPADRDTCLAIFDSNATSFAAEDRAAFAAFLDQTEGPYFVMEHDGTLVGCGGYALAPQPGTAALRWGMIRKDLQRQGLGRFLLMYCLREIGKTGPIEHVHVDCPQSAARFFEGQGFKLAARTGDRVEMSKRLTVCN